MSKLTTILKYATAFSAGYGLRSLEAAADKSDSDQDEWNKANKGKLFLYMLFQAKLGAIRESDVYKIFWDRWHNLSLSERKKELKSLLPDELKFEYEEPPRPGELEELLKLIDVSDGPISKIRRPDVFGEMPVQIFAMLFREEPEVGEIYYLTRILVNAIDRTINPK